METELKFALSPGARQSVERVLASRAEDASRHTAVSTYFDTPDLRLHEAGFSLRVRRRSDRPDCVQTVKSGGSSYRRGEWEWPVAGETPDTTRLDEVPGLAPLLGDHPELRALFRTEVERCRKTLHPRPHSTVEVAFDEGVIVAGDRREPLAELEIELKQGPPDALLGVGLDLAAGAGLPLLLDSKAERGYRLAGTGQPIAHTPAPSDFAADVTVADAFSRLVDAVLEHLLGNHPAATAGDQVEGVHQMRVAVRRLRSLLVLFRPRLERHAGGRFEDELRRLGERLGEARDWDVFLDETLKSARDGGVASEAIDALAEAAEPRRRRAHEAAQAAVSGPDFTCFVLALRAWSQPAAAAIPGPAAAERLDRAAAGLLRRLVRKVDRRVGDVDPDDLTTLHAVRKSAKKLRYGIEYLGPALGRHEKRLRKDCNRLQKTLGNLNDLETALARAEELSADRLELTPAVGLLANWLEEQRAGRLAKALHDVRSF